MKRRAHSSINVNLDTYKHLFPALDEALTEGLAEQFQTAISDDTRPVRGLSELPLSAQKPRKRRNAYSNWVFVCRAGEI